MVLIFPLEIAACGQVDPQAGTSEGLSIRLDLYSGDVMHKFMQDLSQLRESSQVTYLLRIHLIE
jgi:hypothetical protein